MLPQVVSVTLPPLEVLLDVPLYATDPAWIRLPVLEISLVLTRLTALPTVRVDGAVVPSVSVMPFALTVTF